MDVVLLPEMLRTLQPKLEQAGRWTWLQEDVSRMQRTALSPVDPDKAYQRFAGIGRMDQATLQALKYLARWREETASDKNRARGFVISDAGMLQLASMKPSSVEQIKAIEDIHPVALSRYGNHLLQVISKAANDLSPVEKLKPLDDRQRRQLKILRSIVQAAAADLEV